MMIDRITSNGLELELAPRRMSGPRVGGWQRRTGSRTRMLFAGVCVLWLDGAVGLAAGVARGHGWRVVGDGVAVVGWAAAVVPGMVLMVRGASSGSGGDRARAVVVGWAWL